MTAPAVVELAHLSKTFAGVRALDDVGLTLRAGAIHGLVGQNGSGKSTLIKVLSGYHAPDPGAELRVRSRPVELPLAPGAFRALGLSFVHQDLGLLETLDVVDNLRVGRYRARGLGRIAWRAERRSVAAALERFGLRIPLDTKVGALRDVDRAILAIVRAVQELEGVEGGLLVLDEPTVYLPRDSVNRLFDTIRGVAGAGNAVLLVTHQLAEIKQVTDRVTVLRDGRHVGTRVTGEVSEPELIGLILGRSLEDLYPDHEAAAPTAPALSAHGLSGGTVKDLSLEVGPGEIVGVTGLVGMGFEEVPYLLMGAQRAGAGELRVGEQRLPAGRMTPGRAMEAGLALVPGNRLRDGVAGGLTVGENVSLPVLRRHFRGGRLRQREERSRVGELLRRFDVRPPDAGRRMATLSGGNQQKAVLSKWLQTEPVGLLMHEPTQGVDVGARKQLFAQIGEAATRGTAVLVASSEYEDLAQICDRVVVLRDGRAVAELRGASLTEDRIVEQCFRTGRDDGG